MATNLPIVGPREREILTAIVETYIATGEPIGSVTLARARTNIGLLDR